MKKRHALSGALIALALTAALFAQRADRGMITGVVSDPGGSVIPGASVLIVNEDTGVETPLQTNEAGAYTAPQIILGVYTVRVEAPGFKVFARTGIQIGGGQVYRQDAVLEIGDVTETVEVSATADMINVTQPEVTHTVNQKYYQDLPVVMGSDIRLAESLLQLQPGYLPMKPNGDPMFRGSQFNSRINGGQTMAVENFFDGAAFGFAEGHQQTHESSPPIEAIREMKVINTTYSAEYGHTSGGFIEYTSKSGTNRLHGSVYEFFANEKLNTRGFFGNKPKSRNNNYGFTVGGPVYIPKVYDGRNKTFFFFTWDRLNFRSGVLPAFGNTVATDAFKQGDFGQLLNLNNQVAVDAAGRQVFEGQVFDPTTTRQVGGAQIRDPFPNNLVPAAHPLRSRVASNIIPRLPRPDRGGLQNNVAGNPAGDQTWELDATTWLIRADHHFSDSFRVSHTFYTNPRPSVRNCGGLQGCTVQFDGASMPEKNTDYIGEGFFQRIATHHAHQQFDWIISNNLLNHTTVAYDRWFMGGNSLSAGVGWPQELWGPQGNGLIEQTAGMPNFNFGGGGLVTHSPFGQPWTRFGANTNNRWQLSDGLTWLRGRHTFKFGGEIRHHQFPFAGWGQSTGGSFGFNRAGTGGFDANGNPLTTTGDAFASFLLGQVDNANFQIPDFPTISENYVAFYAQDEYKVTDRLTLSFGLRFDYQTALKERFDRISNLDTTLPNPGAGGLPGALVFAGEGPGRTGTRKLEDPPVDAFGPRFGFAFRMTEKTVIRGGYGMYYSGVPHSQFAAINNLGFRGNPTAPNLTNGVEPVFFLDDGFPQEFIRLPPFIDPAFANGTSPVAINDDRLKLPRFQNWSLTIQRQLTDNIALDLSYIGNRGSRLIHNASTLGTAANRNDPSVLGLGAGVLQSDINSETARAAGITPPYEGFQGSVAQALRPFPQFQNIGFKNVPTGNSIYHSFQTKLEKRFADGFQFRTAYTWSKLINDGAESGQAGNSFGAGPQNPANTLAGERALSQDDVPHSFLSAWTYELPVMRGKKTGALAMIAGGWSVSGIFRIDSGRPLNITMANDLGGILFNNQKRPDLLTGVDPTPSRNNFDPAADNFFNRSAVADPGPLNFGNAARTNSSIRGFTNIVEDFSVFKDFWLKEEIKMRFNAQFGNVFNRVIFCDPNGNFSSAAFGTVNGQCNSPRSIQFSLRVDF